MPRVQALRGQPPVEDASSRRAPARMPPPPEREERRMSLDDRIAEARARAEVSLDPGDWMVLRALVTRY